MGIVVSEHYELDLLEKLGVQSSNFDRNTLLPIRIFPSKQGTKFCYEISEKQSSFFLKADYYVGVDWLIKGERFIQVNPKLNTNVIETFEKELEQEEEPSPGSEIANGPKAFDENAAYRQLNYLKLLMDAFRHPEVAEQTSNLVLIDWESPQIEIYQKDDALTPFLVVQFLNMLKHIVRKGLKKSYYKVRDNLNNRIKGKILVGANIKQNVLKNRLTKTYCEYQEFGIDHQENRFLKKVLYFCSNYVHQNAALFASSHQGLEHIINYCNPAFELISNEIEITSLKHIKHNPFFKEYKEAIKIGENILKRFAYNISNTSNSKLVRTPPFWIDMSKLFELYVYHHLLSTFNSNEIEFQFATYGNMLDFLITKEGSEMVVDAKYKMHYRSSHIHEDIRQVAGYARLNKVYEALKASKSIDDIIDCLIIYPSDRPLMDGYKLECVLDDTNAIKAYQKIYKIGIPMPYL